jgi:cephalosporin hydroxylase
MWKSYFPQGLITGIDIYDKSLLALPRIKIYQGDQSDAAFLQRVSSAEGPFDIIIDDGSHIQSHIIASFETLFPILKPGGIYVIEDTQTSYWSTYEGSSVEMETVASSMNYFIKRIHDLNHTEWKDIDRKVDEIGLMIETICFYHNLIFVVKK